MFRRRPTGSRQQEREPPQFLEFILGDGEIRVESGGIIELRATPGLTDAGECLHQVDGQNLDLWQVRRKALENVFFASFPSTQL